MAPQLFLGRARRRVALALSLIVLLAAASLATIGQRSRFDDADLAVLASLALDSLAPLPVDETNRYAEDADAAALGALLFADTRLSSNGRVSCATCHRAELSFTDGLRRARGVGDVPRKTMTIVGAAYQQWLFWDGRKDSLWSQALGPLESAVEHGGTRIQYAHLVARHYAAAYEAIFGPLPDFSDRARFPEHAGPHGDDAAQAAWSAMRPKDRDAVTEVFVNVGKAIAAFERTIVPSPSRFDAYVAALLAGDPQGAGHLSDEEIGGLDLFIGRAGCSSCHSGPLFTNGEFHNTGVPQDPRREPDTGRAAGAHGVLTDEFNCRSRWSDDSTDCDHLEFLRLDDHSLAGAFKVPTLRNVELAAPYMNAGQFTTLASVLRHYNQAPAASVGHSELEPLGLTNGELQQLEAFLRSLTGPARMPPFVPPPSSEE